MIDRAELRHFIPSWQDKPKKQILPEIASVYQESRAAADRYHFILDQDNDLYSHTAQCKVKNIISRNTDVGELESQAFDSIEEWFRGASEGVAVWISPSHPIFYPTAKIIISGIQNLDGKKILLNRAIILDLNDEGCLQLAQGMAEQSQNRPLLSSLAEVRTTPLILNSDNWIDVLQELIVAPQIWQKIRSGHDLKDQNEALSQAEIVYPRLFQSSHSQQIAVGGFAGNGSISCPIRMDGLTAFEVFLGHSSSSEGCPKIGCKKCFWVADNEDVKKIQQRLLSACPRCGWKP